MALFTLCMHIMLTKFMTYDPATKQSTYTLTPIALTGIWMQLCHFEQVHYVQINSHFLYITYFRLVYNTWCHIRRRLRKY